MPETNQPTSGARGGSMQSPGRDVSDSYHTPRVRQEPELGIAITTLDGFFTFVNDTWADLHQYMPAEMLGRHLSMCHTGMQMSNMVAPLDEQAVKRGSASEYIRHIDKYGNTFSTYLTVTLQPGRGRQLPRLIRVARPVDDRRVKGTGELSVNWLEETGALILDIGAEGRIRYANQRCLDVLGYRHRQIERLRLADVTRPDHSDQWRVLLDRLRHEGDSANVITVLVTRSGREVVVEGSLSVHIDDTGEVAVRAIMHDITHRSHVEKEVRARRALAQALRDIAVVLNSTLDLSEVLTRTLDNVGGIVEHDAAAVMLVDEGIARVVRARGLNLVELQECEYSVEDTPGLARIVETGQAITPDDEHDGQVFCLPHDQQLHSCLTAPIRLKDHLIGFLVLMSYTPNLYTAAHVERMQLFADHAATALNNALLYEEIQRMVGTLHERNADLKAFSHTVAHDLKSPLQIMIGHANLLSSEMSGDLSPDVIESLQYIEAYAFRMKSMIDNLLLFSELGSAEVRVEPVDMQMMISLVLARFHEKLQARGVTVEVSPDLPAALGFSPWLEEVFANLIDNSIKYIGDDNADPRIRIEGKLVGDTAHYEVIDNGIGIKPDDLPNLFQMFTRFHRHQAEGSGLGLSIARRIVTKLHGDIGAASELGDGTTFWVELPAATGDAYD